MSEYQLSLLQTVLTILGLALALNSLRLQKQEIRRSAKIGALSELSRILERRLEQDEAMIQGLKSQNRDWRQLAEWVNRELKPQLEATQAELLSLIEKYDTSLDLSQIRLALCRRPKKPERHAPDASGIERVIHAYK